MSAFESVQTELGRSLTAAFSSITGNPSIVLTPVPGSLAGEFAWTRYDFQPLVGASLYLGLSPADLPPETLQEALTQAGSSLASLLSARSREQVAAKAFPAASRPNGDPQFGFEITGIGSAPISLAAFISDPLLAFLAPTEGPPPSVPALPNVNNLDLLLDVEMPVSISFGRAQLPLKDVLKLSIGSLVELDRMVSDPVEIIVSNSVIARGEVVVVDGNLGVRIDQVMSRQERLRNLV